ncbi:MAG: DNA translocase FtsK [Clostridia bacterium]|nr:DNA translocase FtsK [Clostridia bacterium]
MAEDKKLALALAMLQIQKKFGKGTIAKLSEIDKEEDTETALVSQTYDFTFTLDGYHKGRLIELYAPRGAGKTVVALRLVAQVQRREGTVAFIDCSKRMDSQFAISLGVDIDNLVVTQPQDNAQAREIIESLITNAGIDLIVFDSINSLFDNQQDNPTQDEYIGQLSNLIHGTNTCIIVTTLTQCKMGVCYNIHDNENIEDLPKMTSNLGGTEQVSNQVNSTQSNNGQLVDRVTTVELEPSPTESLPTVDSEQSPQVVTNVQFAQQDNNQRADTDTLTNSEHNGTQPQADTVQDTIAQTDTAESAECTTSAEQTELIQPVQPENEFDYIAQPYNAPTVDLLNSLTNNMVHQGTDRDEVAKQLLSIMADFNITATFIDYHTGPVLTRYNFCSDDTDGVSKVTLISQDIANRLNKGDVVRIEVTNVLEGLFGIEIPNNKISIVTLRSLLESDEFDTFFGELAFCLGVKLNGDITIADLAELQNILIAGDTSSGKSVFLSDLIISLMYKYSPEQLRFMLVDATQTEFFAYKNEPHLLTGHILNSAEECITGLQWLVQEADKRLAMFKENKVKSIVDFNRLASNNDKPIIPRIVLVIDEYSAYLNHERTELERCMKSIYQKGRQTGIHMIFATKKPNTDVLSHSIKTCFPCRIAFRIEVKKQSRNIIEQGGAEKLIGKGDMLCLFPNADLPSRMQAPYLTIAEVDNVVTYITNNNSAHFHQGAIDVLDELSQNSSHIEIEGDVDSMYVEVLKYITEVKTISISQLQKRFNIGYSRAGRLIDALERQNAISSYSESANRAVFITPSEAEAIINELTSKRVKKS